jgi:tetraacyldisaccharide 4'-kinase
MKKLLRFFASPLAIFYLLSVVVRNRLFDWGVLKSTTHEIPIICIGNLSTGGTGKTPHTEYFAKYLKQEGFSVGILSRGYKRKTKGFLEVTAHHSWQDVGDEPLLYFKHLSAEGVIIAVDANRNNGIKQLIKNHPDLNVILLDDAFQHRYVKAGVSVLLSDYYDPFYTDYILPIGNLREPRRGMKRAQLIGITKSPPVISPIIRRDILSKMKLSEYQKLFFSKIFYGGITSIDNKEIIKQKKPFSTGFLFTGIANPYPLEQHIKQFCLDVVTYRFPDHHAFTPSDIEKLIKDYSEHLSMNKILITTEKDVMRLQSEEIQNAFGTNKVYYIPIEVEINKNDKELTHKIILDYVRKNQTNS